MWVCVCVCVSECVRWSECPYIRGCGCGVCVQGCVYVCENVWGWMCLSLYQCVAVGVCVSVRVLESFPLSFRTLQRPRDFRVKTELSLK